MSSRVDIPVVAPTGRSLLGSAGWMTGSNLIAQAFAYGSLVALARWLEPASFGTVAVATAIVAAGVLFVDQGTWGAVIVERRLSRSILAQAFRRCLGTAVVLAAVMAAVSGTVVEHFAAGGHPGAVVAIAFCLPLHAIAVVPTALLQRSMQFRRLAGVNGVANIASALVAVVLASYGAGVWALVSRQLVLYALIAILSAGLCLPALRSHAPVSTEPVPPRSGARAERWFFSFSVVYALTGSLDKFVVGLFGGAAVVGLYSVAATIAMAPWTQFSAQAGQVLFAAAASHPDDFSRRTDQSTGLMALLMLPMLPVGVLVAPAVLPGVFGPEWAPVVPVFQLLLVVGVGNAIVNCIAEPLTGMGHMPFRTRIMIVQSLATLVALLLLVPIDGIVGAALAQLVVFLPYGALYFTAGARRADTSLRRLWLSVRPAVGVLALQVAVSSLVLAVLMACGLSDAAAGCWAAAAGLAAGVPAVVRTLAGMRSA